MPKIYFCRAYFHSSVTLCFAQVYIYFVYVSNRDSRRYIRVNMRCTCNTGSVNSSEASVHLCEWSSKGHTICQFLQLNDSTQCSRIFIVRMVECRHVLGFLQNVLARSLHRKLSIMTVVIRELVFEGNKFQFCSSDVCLLVLLVSQQTPKHYELTDIVA